MTRAEAISRLPDGALPKLLAAFESLEITARRFGKLIPDEKEEVSTNPLSDSKPPPSWCSRGCKNDD